MFFLGLILALCPSLLWASLATHSFTNLPGRGTYPESIKRITYKKIRVDLSPLSESSTIYRARLFINVNPYWWVRFRKVPEQKFCVVSEDEQEKCLSPLPPRYQYFDATEAVKQALARGDKTLVLIMKSGPAYDFGNPAWYKDAKGKALIHLDVTCDQPLPETAPQIQQPVEISAYSRDGDTMIIWRDPDPIIDKNDITIAEYKELAKLANNPHEIRFRIYRSTVPITPETIAQAELVDEVDPLTIWDEEFYGVYWYQKNDQPVPRMPIKDGKLANYNQGIYVFSNKTTGAFYYAVVKTVDGQEDLSQLVLGKNSLAEPVQESPGTGLVLLRKQEVKDSFYFVQGPIQMNFYVRWEAPPYSNIPSNPYNYLVAVSLNPKHQPITGKHPIDIGLHCWGGSILGGYLWWYEAEKGSLLVTTNQRPYDWWTAYSEAYGTYRNYSDSKVYNYTQKRIRSFVDNFVARHWSIDLEKIIVSGSSMGGSGSVMWGIRNGDYFAYVKGEVGVYKPAESPQFTSSFYDVYGNPNWPVEYDDSRLNPYDYWDTERWLYENVAKDTPFIVFANGRNDNAIGWPQAWKVVKAMQKTKRPFVFRWAMQGHGTRAVFPGGGDRYPTLTIRKDQSLPAFTNCSLDTPLGDTPEEAPDKGQINYYLLWDTDTIVDQPERWEMTIYLLDKAPKDSCTVDITPRRLQHFVVEKEHKYYWRNINMKTKVVIQEGTITPDKYGLLTIPQAIITKNANRILISKNSFALVLNPLELKIPFVRGREGEVNIQGAGGVPPYNYSITDGELPPGLELDSEKGLIFGTPEKTGIYSFEITLKDSLGETVSKSYTLQVFEPNLNLHFKLPLPTEISNTQKIIVGPDEAGKLPYIVKNASSGTTILLKDGYYQLNDTLWFKKPNVTLRSLSGNRERVILDGDFQVGEIIGILAPYITIADLTIKNARYHAIHLGGNGHYAKLINLHLLDCGEQLVKVNPGYDGSFNDYGILANSLLEYTDEGRGRILDPFHNGSCYTDGIDALKAQGWWVVNNIFKNIYCFPGRSLPQAILFWRGCRDTVVEDNKLINCPIGIQFGLGSGDRRIYEDLDYTASHIGGIIRNNFIFSDGEHKFDTGIGLWAAKDTKVLNNTIYTPIIDSFASIDLRYSETQANVINNLVFKPVTYRGGSAEEKKTVIAQKEWFKDPETGDLHLRDFISVLIDQGEPLGDDLVYDIDGVARENLPDIGADEWEEPTCTSETLDQCTTPEDCQAAGGYWYDDFCLDSPPVLPDLAIEKLVTPRYWRCNRKARVSLIVKNIGEKDITEAFTVLLKAQGETLAKAKVNGIKKGQRKLLRFRFNLPNDLTGKINFEAEIDPENLIPELEEENNSLTKTVIIRCR